MDASSPYWLNGALLPAVWSTAGKCRADSREENDGLPVVSSKPASQRLAVCLLLVDGPLTARWQFAYWKLRLTPIDRKFFK